MLMDLLRVTNIQSNKHLTYSRFGSKNCNCIYIDYEVETVTNKL